MKRFALVVVLFFVASAHAQLNANGETSGKGKLSFLGSVNASRYLGVDSTGGYVCLTYGVNDRVDLFALGGVTRIPGESQSWAGGGANIHLAKLLGMDVSTYDYVTMPLSRRREASTALVDLSLVFGRHFGPVGTYTGVNAVIPAGRSRQSTFTPSHAEFQAVFGLVVPMDRWGIWSETDLGRIRTYSVGLGYTWQNAK